MHEGKDYVVLAKIFPSGSVGRHYTCNTLSITQDELTCSQDGN